MNAIRAKVPIKEIWYAYASYARENIRESPVNAVKYKLSPDCCEQMTRQNIVKKNNGKALKKVSRKEIQLSANFEGHRPDFM